MHPEAPIRYWVYSKKNFENHPHLTLMFFNHQIGQHQFMINFEVFDKTIAKIKREFINENVTPKN